MTPRCWRSSSSPKDLSDEARHLVGAAGEVWGQPTRSPNWRILCRKVALSEISSEQCDLALAAALRLVRTAPLDDLLAPAALIAQEIKISVYDALYVALAEIRGEDLLTWDKRLLRGVRGTRFEKTTRPLLSSWTP